MANIAISNIAWADDYDSAVFEIMESLNIHNLEISPFRTTRHLVETQVDSLIKHANKFNIRVVSLQALMFRHPELTIFNDDRERQATFEHLTTLIELAGSIGAKTLIFGAPKAKLIAHHTYNEAFAIAKDFFSQIALEAQKNRVVFCIEPTPSIYGANFIRNTAEAVDIISAIDNDALALNLDIGAMISNNEAIADCIKQNAQTIGHVHVSEPQLARISPDQGFHQKVASALKEISYSKIISIEMKAAETNNISNLRETLRFVREIYS